MLSDEVLPRSAADAGTAEGAVTLGKPTWAFWKSRDIFAFSCTTWRCFWGPAPHTLQEGISSDRKGPEMGKGGASAPHPLHVVKIDTATVSVSIGSEVQQQIGQTHRHSTVQKGVTSPIQACLCLV